MMKMKPKSCSCIQCKRGKHGGGRDILRYDERAYRHQTKIDLKRGRDTFLPGPMGNYYD